MAIIEHKPSMLNDFTPVLYHAIVNKIIESMPEDGPIPSRLKDIFYRCAEISNKYDGSLIISDLSYGIFDISFTDISYGVEINNVLIVGMLEGWGIFDTGKSYIKIKEDQSPNGDCKLFVRRATFSNLDYFNCNVPGKYYFNDIQSSNDLVYKDHFLVKRDPYTIVYPEQAAKFAENRHFICKLPGYSLNESLTLINFNSLYFIAKCANLGENNVFKVYAEQNEHYKYCAQHGLETRDFRSETEFYINDIVAIIIKEERNGPLVILSSEVVKYNGRIFKNHYQKTAKKNNNYYL